MWFSPLTGPQIAGLWNSSVGDVWGPCARKFTGSTYIYGQPVDLRVARKSTTSSYLCKALLMVSSYRAQSNEIHTYGRVSRGWVTSESSLAVLTDGRIRPVSHQYLRSWISVVENHDDVIKWKHFHRYWPCAVDSPHKGQWYRALMFSLTCAWT